jgi:hypothetical protein
MLTSVRAASGQDDDPDAAAPRAVGPVTGAATSAAASAAAGASPSAGVIGSEPDADAPTDQFAAIREAIPEALRAPAAKPKSKRPADPRPAGQGPADLRPADLGPATARPDRPGQRSRRSRVAVAVAAVVAILAAGSVARTLAEHHRAPAVPSSNTDTIRRAAAAWVASQVTRSVIVSCDPVMCAALETRGTPVTDLLTLTPGAASPLHSTVIVATAAIRRQLGSRLGSVYAPVVIASFGSGDERIDVRAIAPRGAAAYLATLSGDVLERKESGAELLLSDRVVVGATARAQLSAGEIDSRLLVTIAALAAARPIDVLSFGDPAPGAGAVVSPLRSAELARAPGAPRISSSGFVRSIFAFLRVQRFPFAASSMQEAQLPGGGAAVRVEFAAPSPLSLLTGSVPLPSGR